jgi:hypothetical protein
VPDAQQVDRIGNDLIAHLIVSDDDAAQLAWDELLQLLADARMFLESLRGHGQGLNHA